MRRAIIVACVAGASLVGAATMSAGAAGAPRGNVHIANFSLVIEATSTATRGFSVHGSDGVCTMSASGTLTETATYLRGRGVNLQFVVQGKGSTGFGLKRIGNTTAITTRVRVTRKIEGSVTGSLSRGVPDPTGELAPICQGLSVPDLSTKGCPETHSYQADWGFERNPEPGGDLLTAPAATFALRLDVKSAPTLSHGPGSCGYTIPTRGFLALNHEFPHIPDVNPAAVPFAKILGHQHAFLVRMTSGTVKDKQQQLGTPPLIGFANDSGSTNILLRFIRQP